MELSEVIDALSSSLKSAGNIVKALIEISVEVAVTDSAIELKLVLIEAVQQVAELQTAFDAQQRRITDLEQEVVDLKAVKLELDRYEFKTVGPGATAYVLKPGGEGTEPEHWLCVHCAGQKFKSILQFKEATLGRRIYVCPQCKGQVVTPNPAAGVTIETVRARDRFHDFGGGGDDRGF